MLIISFLRLLPSIYVLSNVEKPKKVSLPLKYIKAMLIVDSIAFIAKHYFLIIFKSVKILLHLNTAWLLHKN